MGFFSVHWLLGSFHVVQQSFVSLSHKLFPDVVRILITLIHIKRQKQRSDCMYGVQQSEKAWVKSLNHQCLRNCRLTSSSIAFVSFRSGLSSSIYLVIVLSNRSTGNSPRVREDCGCRTSSTQSFSNTAMSDDIACTFS